MTVHMHSHTFREESLSAVREWLKQLPSQGLEAVDCGSFTLDAPQIAAVEKAVLDVQVQCAVCLVWPPTQLLCMKFSAKHGEREREREREREKER